MGCGYFDDFLSFLVLLSSEIQNCSNFDPFVAKYLYLASWVGGAYFEDLPIMWGRVIVLRTKATSGDGLLVK